MLRLLRDADAPLEMVAAARNCHRPHCDLITRRTGAVRPVQVSRSKELATPFQLMRVTGNETEMDVKQSS